MRNIHKLFNAVVFVFGMLFLAGSIAEAQVAVSLPNVTGQVGVKKDVAVTVGSLAGQNVTAFQFTLTYDQTVVNIAGVNTAGMIADAYKGNLLVNTSVPGKITVAAAGATALTGSGALLSFSVTPLKSGNSALTLSPFTFNEGTPAATITNGSFNIPSTSFLVPDTTVKAAIGGPVTIPIFTDDLASQNVKAFNITVTFNPAIVKIDGYSTAGTQTSGWTLTKNTATAGQIQIAGASATNLSGKGTLLNLTGTVVAAGKSNIAFTSVVLNEGSPVIGAIDGSVTITLNVKPAFTKSLKDTTIAENQAITYTYAATDANADSVKYSFIGTAPTGASINATTGVFTWTPSYTQAGTYTIAVKAADPSGMYDSTSAKITVTNVNRKPTLTSRAPSQKIDSVTAGTNVYFKVSVSDLDAQAITYTWKVNGAQVKTGGDSTYTSTFALGTTNNVVCVFSDGAASDSTTWSFKAVKSNTTNVETMTGAPTEYVLGQNYPNPFNPTTNIRFGLPKAAPVTLEIYNIMGQKVRTLLTGSMMSAAFHNVTWDAKDDMGRNVASGMYLYRISADKFVSTMKMMLMK
ncbi:MAG: putative Ig domain-containing protein [Acidobacteriota bacterium]